jgi:hypothetical protein
MAESRPLSNHTPRTGGTVTYDGLPVRRSHFDGLEVRRTRSGSVDRLKSAWIARRLNPPSATYDVGSSSTWPMPRSRSEHRSKAGQLPVAQMPSPVGGRAIEIAFTRVHDKSRRLSHAASHNASRRSIDAHAVSPASRTRPASPLTNDSSSSRASGPWLSPSSSICRFT